MTTEIEEIHEIEHLQEIEGVDETEHPQKIEEIETERLDTCENDETIVETKRRTGGWRAGMLLLLSVGFVAMASAAVEVNMVLFLKLALRKSNANAASTFGLWIGTLYICTIVGALLSELYGRFLTTVLFQVVLFIGLLLLSLTTELFMLEPKGCEKSGSICDQPSQTKVASFFFSIYLIAFGSGAIEPALATLGADQFDDGDSEENKSETSFFSYYYLALNFGYLIAETVLVYLENLGEWAIAFWISASCGLLAVVFLLSGSRGYRKSRPTGNLISRFGQVIVAAIKKARLDVPVNQEELYEVTDKRDGAQRLSHKNDFKFLDKAAVITPSDKMLFSNEGKYPNPWHLCTVTQVEEVKSVLRLLPIWWCTIVASMVFAQVSSLFVEQGAAMDARISKFNMPPASMTVFDIVTTASVIILYGKVIVPLYTKVTKKTPKIPSKLQRLGIGMAVSGIAMIVAGLVEQYRRKYANESEKSSLTIFWQVPQYVLAGVSEALINVAQWEFFASRVPSQLKSFGLGLSMSAPALGSYLNALIVYLVMKATTKNGKPGWIPNNLNEGHLDRFFYLSAGLVGLNLLLFVFLAYRLKSIAIEKKDVELKDELSLP